MARVRVGRGETASIDVSTDGKLTKRYTQQITVELEEHDPPYTAAEIPYLSGMPRAGRTTYRPRPGIVIPFAICRSVKPKPRGDSRRLWDVTVDYSYEGNEDEEQSEESDFISLAPKFEPFTDSIDVAILKDWDGKDIVDPLGELFDSPTMTPIPLAGVKVTRYVPEYDENTLASWLFCTNDGPWRGQPEDAWLIRSVTGAEVEVGAMTLGQITFEIVSNPLELEIEGQTKRVGWLETKMLLSEDFKTNATPAKRETNRNDVGMIRRTKIDKDGKKTTDTKFLAFRKYRQRAFGAIA
jgi:hypothetical protein